MAIGRENHISIASYANDRKHTKPPLFFIRHYVNYDFKTALALDIHHSLMQGTFSNKSGIPKIIDAQVHLADRLMFITCRINPFPSLSCFLTEWPTFMYKYSHEIKIFPHTSYSIFDDYC